MCIVKTLGRPQVPHRAPLPPYDNHSSYVWSRAAIGVHFVQPFDFMIDGSSFSTEALLANIACYFFVVLFCDICLA